MDPDILLIQKMKAGDDAAIDVFIKKYYPHILQYCRLHIKDYGYAEDMTQEAFIKFFHSFGQYQHYGKALNYLYVITANVCKDFYKKKTEHPLDDIEEHQAINFDEVENRIDVEMALQSLSPELHEVAILYFFQELRQKDIAIILGIGVPLVKYRIRKVKESLTAYLGLEV